MAITKSIIIDGKEVQFRASAAVPRMYRIRFRRDIFRDLLALQADIKASEETGEKEDAGENSTAESSIVLDHLEIFENIAYVMAKHADRLFPTRRTSGWTAFPRSPSMRCCRSCWICGRQTWRLRCSQKKISPD